MAYSESRGKFEELECRLWGGKGTKAGKPDGKWPWMPSSRVWIFSYGQLRVDTEVSRHEGDRMEPLV